MKLIGKLNAAVLHRETTGHTIVSSDQLLDTLLLSTVGVRCVECGTRWEMAVKSIRAECLTQAEALANVARFRKEAAVRLGWTAP